MVTDVAAHNQPVSRTAFTVLRDFVRNMGTQISIAPLVVFRVLFGGVMLASIIRFAAKGWIHDLYIAPKFYFTYYGFEWVQPLGENGMYLLFAVMGLSALMIMLGSFYRVATIVFFLSFTYVELIDKTNYLNHYYFVSLVSFLLIWLPTQRWFSIDAWRHPAMRTMQVPKWTINVLKLQLGIVYFFAGLAKLNSEWLLEAMPLKIWLPAHSHLSVIGNLLAMEETAYFFSWGGVLYDLSIPFLLLFARTRPFAYLTVIVFHLLTAMLFQIGMFPYIMILCTLIFFPPKFHEKLIGWFQKPVSISQKTIPKKVFYKPIMVVMTLFFIIQLALPFRYLLYPGNLYWTEQGYRFSWRVMLMEKAGYTTFLIKDKKTGREGEATVTDYLTPNQEKMMATQPDMILQFAHFLKKEYQKQGIKNPEIRAKSFVTLNGQGSRPFINDKVNLAELKESFVHKDWILPYEN